MKSLKKFARNLFPALYAKLAYVKMRVIMLYFRFKYPNCKLFFSVFEADERKCYSQYNQDYIVYENFFRDVENGIYCDVGANHPLNISNTRLFEELGWTGLAFEPLPHMKELWQQYRNADFYPIAASDCEGKLEFSIVDDVSGWEDMLSYIKKTGSQSHKYKSREIEVRARPLRDIFREQNVHQVDYMSIDVEGHEINVLRGIDFGVVDIKVITIENNFGGVDSSAHYGDDAIREYLFEKDYVLWGRIVGLDDIFVSKHYLQKSAV